MNRHLRLLALAAFCLITSYAFAITPHLSDPVEELRLVLRTPVRDPGNQDELLWRQRQLQARAKALGIGDLRRALQLLEWRYEDREEAIAAVDRPIRDAIANRLIDALRRAFQSKYVPVKLGAIAQAGEMGTTTFGTVGRTALAAVLAPDLAKLTSDPNPAVRQAAAHAITRINPEPRVALPALANLLRSPDVTDRKATADALLTWLRSTVQMRRNTSTSGPSRPVIARDEVVRIDQGVIPLAGRGVNDPDPQVRQLCVEVLEGAASLLTDLIEDVPQGLDFPPPGRRPTPNEQEQIDDYRNQVEQERNLLLPIARALTDQAAILTRALEDRVPQVRLLAARTLDQMGQARYKLLRKAASVPELEEAPAPKEKTQAQPGAVIQIAAQQQPVPTPKPRPKPVPARVKGVPDPLLGALRIAMPALAERAVGDRVPQIRLAAVDALETLGTEAAPVVPALARALQDCWVFVRLASTRVLGRVGPVDIGLTVPILARLVFDPDLDVELQALNTLGIYGARAAAAVPELAAATQAGDPERRLEAVHTLEAIGLAARTAIPAIIRVLNNPDARVRTVAAEALGRFGPIATSAVPALEKALNDPKDTVRQAASDALLAITANEE